MGDSELARTLETTTVALVSCCLLSIAAPAQASYYECVVQKETELLNRPDGITMPRWPVLEKGAKAVPRDTQQDWTFVLFWDGSTQVYGWMPSKALGRCKAMDGTP
jgi:hypothetical protein